MDSQWFTTAPSQPEWNSDSGTYFEIAAYVRHRCAWNAAGVAAWLDPSLITGDRVVYMDVATEHGPAYGDTLIYTDADKPQLVPARVRAILDVDLPRLQTMIIDRLSK